MISDFGPEGAVGAIHILTIAIVAGEARERLLSEPLMAGQPGGDHGAGCTETPPMIVVRTSSVVYLWAPPVTGIKDESTCVNQTSLSWPSIRTLLVTRPSRSHSGLTYVTVPSPPTGFPEPDESCVKPGHQPYASEYHPPGDCDVCPRSGAA